MARDGSVESCSPGTTWLHVCGAPAGRWRGAEAGGRGGAVPKGADLRACGRGPGGAGRRVRGLMAGIHLEVTAFASSCVILGGGLL